MNWYKKAQINEGKAKVRDDGWYIILGKNTKRWEGQWRVSIIEPDGIPYVHLDYPSYEEAEDKFNTYPGIEKNVYELV